MRIAVEGCCHGELDKIYSSVRTLENNSKKPIDLVVICGDFQAIRNESDLDCMAVPAKYKKIGSFWKYYSGKTKAPYPTIFIGGNHEASNHLRELFYGGWVCDNIYFMGYSSVINFGGLRIGGLSGIFNQKNYKLGHHEITPYNHSTIRSAYHVREYEINKMLQVQEPVDVFLSHDWPRGIERYGELETLVKEKEFFKSEVISNTLGSGPNELVLSKIKPAYWFSAHLHVRFSALVNHATNEYSNSAKSFLGKFQDLPKKENATKGEIEKKTRFLSLDKCLGKRKFLEIIEIEQKNPSDLDFYYDMEWLSITKAMDKYLSLSHNQTKLPTEADLKQEIATARLELEEMKKAGTLDLKIPHNFEITSPPYVPNFRKDFALVEKYKQPIFNPQTEIFCKEIGIENKFKVHSSPLESSSKRVKVEKKPDESEIVIDEDDLF